MTKMARYNMKTKNNTCQNPQERVKKSAMTAKNHQENDKSFLSSN